MSYLTIRLPDDKIKRLKQLAAQRHLSMSALFEQISTQVLQESTQVVQVSEDQPALPAATVSHIKALPFLRK